MEILNKTILNQIYSKLPIGSKIFKNNIGEGLYTIVSHDKFYCSRAENGNLTITYDDIEGIVNNIGNWNPYNESVEIIYPLNKEQYLHKLYIKYSSEYVKCANSNEIMFINQDSFNSYDITISELDTYITLKDSSIFYLEKNGKFAKISSWKEKCNMESSEKNKNQNWSTLSAQEKVDLCKSMGFIKGTKFIDLVNNEIFTVKSPICDYDLRANKIDQIYIPTEKHHKLKNKTARIYDKGNWAKIIKESNKQEFKIGDIVEDSRNKRIYRLLKRYYDGFQISETNGKGHGGISDDSLNKYCRVIKPDSLKELMESLLKQANEKYPIGTSYYDASINDIKAKIKGKLKVCTIESNTDIAIIDIHGGYVYYKGKWADIIEDSNNKKDGNTKIFKVGDIIRRVGTLNTYKLIEFCEDINGFNGKGINNKLNGTFETSVLHKYYEIIKNDQDEFVTMSQLDKSSNELKFKSRYKDHHVSLVSIEKELNLNLKLKNNKTKFIIEKDLNIF